MLREFLRKIFSPPQPIEDKRVQEDDFARLKKPVKVDDDDDEHSEICDVEHGKLSLQHGLHAPLTRSIGMHASSAAYGHYLQRNAARADNWSEFENILHPKIEPFTEGSAPASFLTAEEQLELANPKPVSVAPVIKPFLRHEPEPEPAVYVSAMLVRAVEKFVKRNSSGVEKSKKPWKFESGYPVKKAKVVCNESALRICNSWLITNAKGVQTPAEGLRELAASDIVRVRAAVAANDRIPFDCLWSLAHDENASVRLKLAKNPNCSIELLNALGSDADQKVAAEAQRIYKSITG
jgi:hypothetical protein